MHTLLPTENSPITRPGSGGSGFTWKILAAATLLVVGVFYFWSGHTSGPAAPPARRLTLGSAEQAYISKVEIQNISLSRAENFLHQEVTALTGDVLNHGDRSLTGVELTVEFFDELHQIILRESRLVLAAPSPVLHPGEHRTFEISFEHIPSSWNMQQPTVRVSGLEFAPAKE